MSDILDLMGHKGVNVAAELAVPWCQRRHKNRGDYLEFGTYRGESFTAFFRTAAKYGLDDMRFFGFDSFEGLPETETCPPATDPANKSAFVAGTLLMFDDWLAFDGHPFRGEPRACREWLEANPQFHLSEYFKYTRTGVAFIVSLLDANDLNALVS